MTLAALPVQLPDTISLSAGELRRLNQQLKPMQLKICNTHRGDPLPLDDAHFYRRGDGSFYGECKHCSNQRTVAAARQRYQTDAAYADRRREESRERYGQCREKRLSYAIDYRVAHGDAVRERGRQYHADVARWRRNGLLPTPPGMAVVVYEPQRERLRLWNRAGKLAASEVCTAADWHAALAQFVDDGYAEVPGWDRLVVLAKFEGEGMGE